MTKCCDLHRPGRAPKRVFRHPPSRTHPPAPHRNQPDELDERLPFTTASVASERRRERRRRRRRYERRTNKSGRAQSKGSTKARRYCINWSFQLAQSRLWNTKGVSFPRVSTPQDFFDGGTIMSDDPLHIGTRRATRQPSPPGASARQHERPLLSSHRTARLIGEGTIGALLYTNIQLDQGRARRR